MKVCSWIWKAALIHLCRFASSKNLLACNPCPELLRRKDTKRRCSRRLALCPMGRWTLLMHWKVLATFSAAVTKCHDPGSLLKKKSISFGGSRRFQLMAIMVGRMTAGRHSTGVTADNLHLGSQAGGRELIGKDGLGFWNLEATPSDIPSSTRPHFLILPEEFHPLGIKHSNIWAYRGRLYKPLRKVNGSFDSRFAVSADLASPLGQGLRIS